MADDFDVNELHEFVDEALQGKPSTDSAVPGLLSFGEVRSFEVLAEVLPEYMHEADVQVVLDKLRRSLSDGVAPRNVTALHSAIAKCRKCPTATSLPEAGLGNTSEPDLAIVVESFPIAGLEMLMNELKQAGFSSARVGLTATTRCLGGQSDICAGYLYNELSAWCPKLILSLGLSATKRLLGTDLVTLAEERGHLHWIGGYAILPTHAPGAVDRSERRLDEFRGDLAQAYHFCYGPKL